MKINSLRCHDGCSSVLPERAYLGLGKQIGISGDSYNEVVGLTYSYYRSANETALCPAG